MRFTKSVLGVATLMGALMASGAAMAGPTTTVDGVTIPVGVTSGGFVIDSEQSYETLLTAPGQAFYGAFKVQSISDNAANDTYLYGQNGAYLYGVFTGFTVDTITPPTATTAGTILLKGGQISYYVSPTNVFTVSAGSEAADMVIDGAGAETFLTATPEVLDAAGDTLQITIPAGTTDEDFSGASAIADLDVTGGDAAYNFTTGTFTNPYNPLETADIEFHGSANSGAAGDFGVSGTDFIKANTVPEPATVSLIGAGLLGAAFLGRRKAKKKSA